MKPEEFRKHGHELIDWIADYRARVPQLPVMARTAPGDIKAALPASPPETPENFEEIIRDVDKILVPGLSMWSSPEFFGYFPCNGSPASVLGDFLSTGLGVLGLSWQASPALTELEEVVTDWLRQMIGLSPAWSGVIQDTASTSTLISLLCAREKTTNYALAAGGMQAKKTPLIVYVSSHSHSSVEKAALLAGFGRKNVHVVPHDAEYAMRADALAAMIRARCRGRTKAVRGCCDVWNHDYYRVRSRRGNCGSREKIFDVAARGRGDGGLGDDSSRISPTVEWSRACRLASSESAQVDGRGV